MRRKPRLMVLTDIGADPDDQQSLIRLLVHANEFDIEGILCEHWRGEHAVSPDGQMALVEETLAAYDKVQPHLTRYGAGFPAAGGLRRGLKRGAGGVQFALDGDMGCATAELVGEGRDTEASEWLIHRTDQADPRPLNVCVWGGTADLAQALWRVRQSRDAGETARFVGRLRVHAISDQDVTGPWIRANFPELFYILDHARDGDKMHSCYRGMFLGGDESLTSREWVTTHVSRDHGPLGALYPLETWTGPNPHGCLKEGDTPSWFYFLDNGLHVPERPDYGGWGGRFERDGRFYQDAADTVDGVTGGPVTVWRWRDAFQREFQARMDWCVGEPDGASRPPDAVLNGDGSSRPMALSAEPGEAVVLSAQGSQAASGGALACRWWHYTEAGSYQGSVEIGNAGGKTAEVVVPDDAGGHELHVILEATGTGTPPLTRYRRAILRVSQR
ncbi:MAG: DUF1593 domain-containing protein [Candidatus Brocadiia bacterium]